MMQNQRNNKCLKNCKKLIYPLGKVEDNSIMAIYNDSQYCCKISIVYIQFLSMVLSNHISDHRTLLNFNIFSVQRKRQVSKCLVYQTCSYNLASSRLGSSDCRTILICKLQFSSISLPGMSRPSSCKPLRISHSRRTS